jgi:hypothetical protein
MSHPSALATDQSTSCFDLNRGSWAARVMSTPHSPAPIRRSCAGSPSKYDMSTFKVLGSVSARYVG